MSGSKPACVKSALSAKELWWSAGCSAVSPTALAPPTVPASTAPIINSPGRKKAKPCRGGYRPSTLRSTGNGSPTVSASSRSFSRCTEFHKRPTATYCRLKKPKKAALNRGIFLPHLDNPGVSGHLRGGNAHNHLIFRGFSRCQKVATPRSNRQEVVATVVAKQTVAGGGFFKTGELQCHLPTPTRPAENEEEACAELDPAFHCRLGTCTEQWRFTGPTEKSNQRKTECHQSTLLGLHSCG